MMELAYLREANRELQERDEMARKGEGNAQYRGMMQEDLEEEI